jgi:glycosyltransferase involved in cell wall biosynthesis
LLKCLWLRRVAQTIPIPVAVFITSFHPGGTERQMIELIRRLDRRRFAVKVGCFHREGAWLRRVAEVADVSAFPIRGLARPATVGQAAAFARWCRRHHIQVVQACDLYANVFALPAAALAGVAVRVGSRRELNPDKSPGQIALQRHAYRCAHAIVANSSAGRTVLEHEGVPGERIKIIANGVIANGITVERLARVPGVRPVRTILTVANLRREKAHEVLLRAAAILAPARPDLRFLIAGDGPRAAELRALADTLGLADRVEFLGHVEDVPALAGRADAFVLPSRSEAFPNAAMEAMAAGLPVVASAVGGLLDLIDHGRTGLLVPVDDAGALAAAIDQLAADPARAAQLGATAREDVIDRYSFDRMVRSFEGLYLTQLGLTTAQPCAA